MRPATGRSLGDLFAGENTRRRQPRDHVLIGKERHDIGRPHDWGYPVRGIVKGDMLYLQNYETSRWPAGNPETDFGNCDPGPTKEVVKLLGGYYFDLSFGKRPPDELYDLKRDPECVNNLAHDLAHAQTMEELRYTMMRMLKEEQDPRALGEAAIFDTYKYVGGRAKGYETWLKEQETRLQEALKAKPEKADGKNRGVAP